MNAPQVFIPAAAEGVPDTLARILADKHEEVRERAAEFPQVELERLAQHAHGVAVGPPEIEHVRQVDGAFQAVAGRRRETRGAAAVVLPVRHVRPPRHSREGRTKSEQKRRVKQENGLKNSRSERF